MISNKNKLIISSAGSGKTTLLVNEALKIKTQKVLITTYTEENEQEIKKKFIEVNKCVPANVTIQTWFSFLIEHGVRPYQSHLTSQRVNGLLLVNTQSGIKTVAKFGPIYYPESDVDNHFFSPTRLIYSDKVSKFVVRCNEKGKGEVIERLTKIYHHIFIDEVQDLAGYDLDFIDLLFKSPSRILLVGDPRQVTYLTHNEKRLSQYTNGLIKDFILKECDKDICEIDDTTLSKSYRCNEVICNFSSKLYPGLAQAASANGIETGHDGIFLIPSSQVDAYIKEYSPVQLRYNASTNVREGFPVRNFGESKGLTFDRVLIYPTKTILQYLQDGALTKERTKKTKKGTKTEIVDAFDIAKFYVAITRAKYSVAIVADYKAEALIDGVQKFSVT